MDKTIRKTLEKDFCINCGMCSAVCPTKAITMSRDTYKELKPSINTQLCVNCGLCLSCCPHSPERMLQEAERTVQFEEPEAYGLQDSRCYLMYNKIAEERIKSSSGGVITKLAQHLLQKGMVDGVIHGKRLFAPRGEAHYEACLSQSCEELFERTSSLYAPLNFEPVLNQLENRKTYLAIGTPCVIRGMRHLVQSHKKFKDIKLITCALICSHNVSELYTDFLAQHHKLPGDAAYAVNLRNKDGIADANNFNTHYYTRNGDLLKMNRNASLFTETWRSYWFAMNVCCYCSDLWGRYADISVKDAWSEFSHDPLGRSLCVVRNPDIDKLLRGIDDLYQEEVSAEVVKNNELPSAVFKQREALNKLTLPLRAKENKKNGLCQRVSAARKSKFYYRNLGYSVTKKTLLRGILPPRSKRKAKETSPFRRKKQILVAGGYGYGNVGDEAQCNETLKILKHRYPEYQILNLTPTPDFSYSQHPEYSHDFASRVLFFNQGNKNNCFDIRGWGDKIRFAFSALLILLNAYLVKRDWPLLFINARKARMLQCLKEASLLYFSGGGYLTGPTLSRLWDGMLLCRLCRIFKTPVVMSGQTIGLWGSRLNRWLAGRAFRKVKLITLRDDELSMKDLKAVNIQGQHVFATHDDALFCEKSDERQVPQEHYISINFHYWGMSAEEQKLCMDKIHRMMTYLYEKTGYDFVFIPMHSSDLLSYHDYIERYPSPRFGKFDYVCDFRKIRRVIADSRMCITMKHHPIIFAMGENVPVISLCFSAYYVHKNLGAMQQYAQEECLVNLEDADWYERFCSLFDAVEHSDDIIATIEGRKRILAERKEQFLRGVDAILRS